MVQSLNSTVELTTTGVSYLAIGGNKVGKFLLGNKGFEFYNDKYSNIEKILDTYINHKIAV